jgi:transcriptional regulator with XRE-family HTH domain
MNTRKTTQDWQEALGDSIRAARIEQGLDQSQLADLANVSASSVSALERGRGSSVASLVAVIRALDRMDWLEALAPPVRVSPMRMLQTRRRERVPRQRVRHAAHQEGAR